MPNSYQTIQKQAAAEFTEKRSRFIGYACPAQTPQAAMEFVASVRKQHWDARHNVYAYILRDGVKRYSDDGEPQGTAGVPVLEVLEKSGVCDACVVVTRYFGGILLGAGGLVRAYTHSAHLALEAAGICTMGLCAILELQADYPLYAKLGSFLEKTQAKILHTDFADTVRLTLSVDADAAEQLSAQIMDFSGGKIQPKKIGEKFAEK